MVAVALGVVLVLVGGLLLIDRGSSSDDPAASATPAVPSSSAPAGREAPPSTTAAALEGASATPTTRPPSKQPPVLRSALVGSPLPRAATATGRLARGYPTQGVAPLPGSTIRSSSVSPGAGRLQIALDARVSASTAQVLRFYAVRLGRFGFRSTPAAAVGGSQAAAYRRGGESLTVTVTPVGGSSATVGYTVYGTLRGARG